MTLQPGARVPEFSLPSTQGIIALGDLRGSPFLLSFFTMAFTPV